MGICRGASALVIRCFRRVEHWGDVVTGAAGPVFVFFAWTLTLSVGFAFFDVIARDMGFWGTVLLLPFYFLVPTNMYGQYYLVTHVPPGYPMMRNDKEAAWLTHNPRSLLAPERWGWHSRSTNGSVSPALSVSSFGSGRRVRRCRKCDGPKPERTHHCSVCKRCVLLMDHHCPWVNSCVGLHNQRHFVLFMGWLSLGCWFFVGLGWRQFWNALDILDDWDDKYTPKVLYCLGYILSIAIGFAVPILGGWHLHMVSRGETTIEGHDNDYLERKAKEEGLIYLNPFDLGRKRNLQLFFNIGPGGYPISTLFFPLLVPPASNGWTWPRRPLPVDLTPKRGSPAEESLRANGVGLSLHTPSLGEGLIDPTIPETSSPGGPARQRVIPQPQSQSQSQSPPLQQPEPRHSMTGGEGGLVGDGPGGLYVMGGGDELTDDEDGGGGFWEGPEGPQGQGPGGGI